MDVVCVGGCRIPLLCCSCVGKESATRGASGQVGVGFRDEALDKYKEALDRFTDRVDRVDLAFLPLIEADEDDSDFKTFLEKLNPRAVFVLDPDRREEEYWRMREKALGWGFDPQVFAAENPGDVFTYTGR